MSRDGAGPALAEDGLCRDCLSITRSGPLRRCARCGSPRLIAHPERDQLSIAHIDCDAFYATVEKRDDPSLQDLPVIVGGGQRGVVTTCCYVARTFGVRSAMPMFKALQLCPQAHVIRPDMAKYARVGREVRAMMQALTPLVEPVSIDEAFLDLSGTAKLHDGSPALTLARFVHRIEREVGITVSVGLSYCKFLAKVASDLDKPRGFALIGRAEARHRLHAHPVGLIWGVGAVAQKRLALAGFRTIGDLQGLDEADAVRRLGQEGLRLRRLSLGIDDRPVSPVRETKSVSAETTFETDLSGQAELEAVLFRLCERVAARLKTSDLCGASVTLKLKTAGFKTITRARSGLPPTRLAQRLFNVGRELLGREIGRGPFRLLGIGMSDLHPAADADRGDLADPGLTRDKAIADAIDAIRDRYGEATVMRGITFGRTRRSS